MALVTQHFYYTDTTEPEPQKHRQEYNVVNELGSSKFSVFITSIYNIICFVYKVI